MNKEDATFIIERNYAIVLFLAHLLDHAEA